MPETISEIINKEDIRKTQGVSVVIPNYQGENFIAGCLRSLINQKTEDFTMTIRIVDNGSTDRSEEKLSLVLAENGYTKQKSCADTMSGQSEKKWESYLPGEECYPKVQLLFLGENTGFCHAVNEGIGASEEPYVFLLNNDTTLEQDCVMRLVSFMERHPGVFSASAKMVSMKQPELCDDCGDYFNALGYAFAAGKGKDDRKYQKNRRVFSACAGAAIYRRNIFDEIGMFDENHFAYLEDVDVGYRAGIYGYANYFVHEAVVYHAGSAVSGSRHNAFKVSLSSKNSVYLVYKNMPFLQWVINVPFLLAGYLIKTLFFVRKGLGKTYLNGIRKGILFCFTKEARSHKVPFRIGHMRQYVRIQLQLWINMFRMFVS